MREIHVQPGSETDKAYLAAYVSEESEPMQRERSPMSRRPTSRMLYAQLYALSILVLLPVTAQAAELRLGARSEIVHPGQGHEVHLSGPTVAIARDGGVLVGWMAQKEQANHLYLARPTTPGYQPVRVNPAGLEVESLHQSPGIALGPEGEVYVSWASKKARPEGTLFASDLRLSRSLDGGHSFEPPLRINEDRPISHSFEGFAVTPDGTVLVAWIDSRDGWEKAGTYLARIGQRGTRVDSVSALDSDTCVCCRVALTTGPQETVAVLWRKVFPGNLRDMVLGFSRDGGRAFTPAAQVHADRWQIAACPHRGGTVGMDGASRLYVTWYTEGAREEPSLLFTVSTDGQSFTPPTRLDQATASIPDHPRMAVDTTGRTVVVWEDATAVRRRVLLRYITDGGATLSPIHTLSQAIRAYAPDVAVSPTGDFIVVWHEEQFPAIKTIVQPVRLEEQRARALPR